ncbi:3'-5' exoribonuclease [Methanomicrobium sp. W14]|uniref:HD domain-containing protein n=1 Tax=Methanomicrobium sp. W14 TaxID=2817839 RepID=UPI001AEA47A9|nr:HD domain-containing protein [Methanomicrobium sp. W14]MBP2134557.1 3'-5' exoribonuclease [Methanomicrobium sp. W14]
MVKKIYIYSIIPDMAVDSQFVIENPSLKTGRKGKFISCTISDRTGKLSCRIWGPYGCGRDDIESVSRIITEYEGHIFRISGKADKFNDELTVNINDGLRYLSEPVDEKKVTTSDYIYSPADIDGNKTKIFELIDSIKNDGLKELVHTVIKKSDGFFDKPAARTKHHDYNGGLAEHSLEVAQIALSSCSSICGVRLNRDITLAGAILHDIGKCQSFKRKGLYFASLPAYSLIGHITPAMQTLSRYTSFVDDNTYQELLHIIQSHHGEYGEIRPQTPEAWAVHFADNTSAMLHEVSEDLKTAKKGEILWGKRSEGMVFCTESCEEEQPDEERKSPGAAKNQMTFTDCFD